MSGINLKCEQENKNELTVNKNYDLLKENKHLNTDDLIMYILFNDELEMDIDQIISQTALSISKIIRLLEKIEPSPETYIKWLNNNEPKVILRCKEEDMLFCVNNFSDQTKEIWCSYTIDLGRNSFTPFSITSLVFIPFKRKDTPSFLERMIS